LECFQAGNAGTNKKPKSYLHKIPDSAVSLADSSDDRLPLLEKNHPELVEPLLKRID